MRRVSWIRPGLARGVRIGLLRVDRDAVDRRPNVDDLGPAASSPPPRAAGAISACVRKNGDFRFQVDDLVQPFSGKACRRSRPQAPAGPRRFVERGVSSVLSRAPWKAATSALMPSRRGHIGRQRDALALRRQFLGRLVAISRLGATRCRRALRPAPGKPAGDSCGPMPREPPVTRRGAAPLAKTGRSMVVLLLC